MELEEIVDKEKILEKRVMIGRYWEVRVDEDLSMEERRMKWRMVEAARKKKAKERRVMVTNRELWVEEEKWNWDGGGKRWMEEEEVEKKKDN